MSEGNFQRDVRWVPVYNRSGEIIPPFAAMKLGNPSVRERQIVWDVTKPDSASAAYQRPEQHLFNGSALIPKGGNRTGWGAGTMDYPAMVLIEDVADANELAYDFYQSLPVANVGFRANSWKLHYGEEAYTLLAVIESQVVMYSADGSPRAFVAPNVKPVVISTTLAVDADSYALNTDVKTLPIDSYETALDWPQAANGLGVMAPLSGVYQCSFQGEVTVNDDEPPETEPDVKMGFMVSDDEPIATNWVAVVDWSAVLRFNRYAGWGFWNTWNGWVNWAGWAGWAGYSDWYAGTRSTEFTVRLERGQWLGVGLVAATTLADVEVHGASLSLVRLGS